VSKKLTINEIKEKIKDINPKILITSDVYVNNTTKLNVTCIDCGHQWSITWANLKKGRTCRKCSDIKRGKKRRLSFEKVKTKLNIINKNIQLIDEEYVNAHTLMRCQCNIDGHIWYATWSNLSKGFGCPKCSNHIKTTVEYIKNELIRNNIPIDITGNEFENTSQKKIKCICKICGYEWNANVSRLMSGSKCPQCVKNNAIGGLNLKHANRNRDKFLSTNAIVYVIRCSNDEESFYKIGVTKNNAKKRFNSKRDMPYNFNVLIEINTNLYDAILLERELLSLIKHLRYNPKIKFEGWTECFKIDLA